MQTNGPIQDYARYVSVTSSQLLRPHAAGETSDAAIYIYRRAFSSISSISLLPSLFISGFVVVFMRLLFPRLFETQYQSDTTMQVLEFCLFLFGGLTAGFIVATLGLARIATFAHILVEAAVKGEEVNRNEIERRANPYFLSAYRAMLRSLWFTLWPTLVTLVPIVLGGLSLAITSDKVVLPSLIAVYSFTLVPVGVIWSLTRMNIGLGAVSVALNEKCSAKEAINRSKYLFGNKSRPIARGNPASSGIFLSLLVYFFLRIGYSMLFSIFDLSEMITNQIKMLYLKVLADLTFSILPEFLAIWLITPYVATAAALFYYQRRIVVEGLDISILNEKLPTNRR